jgi:hypothetical protein
LKPVLLSHPADTYTISFNTVLRKYRADAGCRNRWMPGLGRIHFRDTAAQFKACMYWSCGCCCCPLMPLSEHEIVTTVPMAASVHMCRQQVCCLAQQQPLLLLLPAGVRSPLPLSNPTCQQSGCNKTLTTQGKTANEMLDRGETTRKAAEGEHTHNQSSSGLGGTRCGQSTHSDTQWPAPTQTAPKPPCLRARAEYVRPSTVALI